MKSRMFRLPNKLVHQIAVPPRSMPTGDWQR